MKLKDKRWFKLITNMFIVVTVIYLIWMFFFDTNSWFVRHRELNETLKEAKEAKEYYETELAKDKAQLDALSKDSLELEKYAREQYYMKKADEEVFIPVIEETEEE